MRKSTKRFRAQEYRVVDVPERMAAESREDVFREERRFEKEEAIEKKEIYEIGRSNEKRLEGIRERESRGEYGHVVEEMIETYNEYSES